MEKKTNIKKFKCLGNQCPNHCCGTYEGISSKLSVLGDVNFTEIILTKQDVQQLNEIGRQDLIVKKEGSSIMRIRTAEDGTCFALKEGRCEVYNARPAICKAYPLYLDLFAGLCYVNECKAFDWFPLKRLENYREELLNLLEVYRFWIDHYQKELRKLEENVDK